MFLLSCLTLLWGFSYSDVPRVVVFLGQPLSLPPGRNFMDITNHFHWKKGTLTLGKTRNGTCVSGCVETSKIFTNGTFWKSRVEWEDEGQYSVEVYNRYGVHIHRAEIFLQITDIMHVTLGESPILPPGRTAPEELYEVQWSKGEQLLQKLHEGRCIHGCAERYQILPNGSLWLGPVQQDDGGTYSVEVYNEYRISIHQAEIFLQINNETSWGGTTSGGRLSFSAFILISVGVIILITMWIIGGLLYKFTRKQRGAGDKVMGKSMIYANVKRRKGSGESHQVTWSNEKDTGDPGGTLIYMEDISTFRRPQGTD
ncbi:pregnancy-specific glycoprotein 22-like [Xenopus laevis]|uniref:Pregnancy-specific glycoprotein 22-like n=2 Tax=Xenopus laevis TaxID=8355 RepID=A0A1L8HBU8_XENLA|nr:pregnancy-specific glycoprotein 22-like [Xenopus laevis]OCT93526.1 hypothetical protein XELAEV_18011204mg [Xenopus laevis]